MVDAAAIAGTVLAGGGIFVTVGVAIGRQMSTRRDLLKLSGHIHEFTNWRSALAKQLDDTYTRKDTIAVELRAIQDSLKRLEGDVAFIRQHNAGV